MEQTLTHWVCACKNIGRPYDGVQEREWTVRVNVSISLFLFESYALGASLHHYLYILNPSSLNGHSMLNSNDVSSNINLHKVEHTEAFIKTDKTTQKIFMSIPLVAHPFHVNGHQFMFT